MDLIVAPRPILGIGDRGTNGMAVSIERLPVDAVAGNGPHCSGGGERISVVLRAPAAG
jgi:hypothetical protein